MGYAKSMAARDLTEFLRVRISKALLERIRKAVPRGSDVSTEVRVALEEKYPPEEKS